MKRWGADVQGQAKGMDIWPEVESAGVKGKEI
jgi:hypothetical protein